MKTTVIKEITELHEFFESWFAGNLESTEIGYSRFQDVLSPTFHMVSPDGKKHHHATLLAQIKNAHAARPGLKITIKNTTLHLHDQGYVLATYEEWQEFNGKTTTRLSSVLFKENTAMPNDLQWIHVHETWLNN